MSVNGLTRALNSSEDSVPVATPSERNQLTCKQVSGDAIRGIAGKLEARVQAYSQVGVLGVVAWAPALVWEEGVESQQEASPGVPLATACRA